jgi:predicted transcriptional regulator
VLDRQGRVRWAKDGSLSSSEVSDVIGLVQKLIGSGQS